jgi:hypothetical protein
MRTYLPPFCESCGAFFQRAATGRPKRYCNDACRQRAHRARRTARWAWRANSPRLRDHLVDVGFSEVQIAALVAFMARHGPSAAIDAIELIFACRRCTA